LFLPNSKNDFAQKLKRRRRRKKVFELKPAPIGAPNSLTIFVFGEMDSIKNKVDTFYLKVCTFVKKNRKVQKCSEKILII